MATSVLSRAKGKHIEVECMYCLLLSILYKSNVKTEGRGGRGIEYKMMIRYWSLHRLAKERERKGEGKGTYSAVKGDQTS